MVKRKTTFRLNTFTPYLIGRLEGRALADRLTRGPISHFHFRPVRKKFKMADDTEMNDETAPTTARAGAILDARPTFFNNGFGFPDRYCTRLRYCSAITLSSTSGSIGKQVWNMNSIFDPDATGTGHQPLWHDTLIGIYNHYSVTKSTLRVRFIATHATMPFIVGLIGDDDGSTSSTYETLMESNHAISDELGPLTSSFSSTVLTASFNCEKNLGIDPFASQTYKTVVGGNPSELYCVTMWCKPHDGLATGTVYAIAELHQDVLFTELKDQSQS